MDISKLPNPYDYANPVQNRQLFAGRGAALARIAYLLEQTGPTRPVRYIALHGPRAAGKTSLLNMTEILARDHGFITVRVDLVPGDASPPTFFLKVYEELVGAISKTVGLRTPDGREITARSIRRIASGQVTDDSFPLEFPEAIMANSSVGNASEVALRADLEYFARRADRPIVLLIDEAQVIAEEEHILSVLRALGMRLQGYMFIIAGTTDLVQRINEVFGHLLRQFELLHVDRFEEEEEVASCISRPLESLGLNAVKSFKNITSTIYDLSYLTSGNPYEIQLYCHVMFSRWQTGAAEAMTLSPETLDDVRSLLEAGRDVHQSPMIAAIRRMPDKQLIALNILCSSLGHATMDDIWFLYCLFDPPKIEREELQQYLDKFVQNGLLEINNGIISREENLFDEIFVRVWTLSKVKQKWHTWILSRLGYDHILAKRLADFLRDIHSDAQLLRTCCLGMHPSHLERGLEDLTSLRTDREVHFTIRFLHEAIVTCDMPSSFNLTTVTCIYRGQTGVRWLFSKSNDDFDLSANPAFKHASALAAELGGVLRSEITHVQLQPWATIEEWLVSTISSVKSRQEMAECHISASFRAYRASDFALAASHLSTSFELTPSWESANNLAYLSLKQGDVPSSLGWSDKAIKLSCIPQQSALSKYNAAIASFQAEDFQGARNNLASATEDLSALPFSDYQCSFLLVPAFQEGAVVLKERENINLPEAISKANELVSLAEGLKEAKGSTS